MLGTEIWGLFEGKEGMLNLIVSSIIIGGSIIIINVVVHSFKSYITYKRDNIRRVENNIKYVLESAENLCRLLILILTRPRTDIINDYLYEILALRLAHFLSVIYMFKKLTYNITNVNKLESIEYLLYSKMPMALRGRIYNYRKLDPEIQESLMDFSLYCKVESPVDLTLNCLINQISRSGVKHNSILRAVDFFKGTDSLIEKIENRRTMKKEDAPYVALCHFAIYLIDLLQDIGCTPKYEEYRIYFIRIIKKWNVENVEEKRNKIYLYRIGDLTTEDYYDTFSDVIYKNLLYCDILYYKILNIFGNAGLKLYKKIAIWKRGRKFKHRHHPKKIHKNGIIITMESSGNTISFNIQVAI